MNDSAPTAPPSPAMDTETFGLPVPTPELVAALANHYIEVRERTPGNPKSHMFAAFYAMFGGMHPWQGRGAVFCHAAHALADALDYPKPYKTTVVAKDGPAQEPEHHTITYFADTDGFTVNDLTCIHALELGESYIVAGAEAHMLVERVL